MVNPFRCVFVDSQTSESNQALEHSGCVVFEYVGTYQKFSIPRGKYLFELWGAGSGLSMYEEEGPSRGLGAYVSGVLNIVDSRELYAFVGGRGGDNTPKVVPVDIMEALREVTIHEAIIVDPVEGVVRPIFD